MTIIQQIAWTLASDAIDLIIVAVCFYFLWMLRDVVVGLWKRRQRFALSPYRLVRDEEHEW